jgi:hypothetical protein
VYGVFTYVVTLSLSMLEREARERCSLFFFSLSFSSHSHIYTLVRLDLLDKHTQAREEHLETVGDAHPSDQTILVVDLLRV